VSSNEATNMVTEVVGLGAVVAALADAGARSSSYGCMYSDFAAAAQGARRDTTAGDLVALMSAVVTGAVAGPEWTPWMTAMLGRQHDRLLTAHVPDGVPFGSKSGWVDGIRHDVAFVGAPGPNALVVAVCTRGYDQVDAEEAIRAIGLLAVTLATSG
jgi:beta-lactamase class A